MSKTLLKSEKKVGQMGDYGVVGAINKKASKLLRMRKQLLKLRKNI